MANAATGISVSASLIDDYLLASAPAVTGDIANAFAAVQAMVEGQPLTELWTLAGNNVAILFARVDQDLASYPFSGLLGPVTIGVSGDPSVLAADWPLDEGSGATVHDASGNGNDGTIEAAGCTWTQVTSGPPNSSAAPPSRGRQRRAEGPADA